MTGTQGVLVFSSKTFLKFTTVIQISDKVQVQAQVHYTNSLRDSSFLERAPSSNNSFPIETIKERTSGKKVPHLPVGESPGIC